MAQTSKDMVKGFFEFNEIKGVPFIPVISNFAATLEQVKAQEMFSDPTLLSKSLINSHKLFGYNAITIVIPPLLVAEACGCDISNSHEDEHGDLLARPNTEGLNIEDLDISGVEKKGRVPVFFEAAKRIVMLKGRDVAVFGIIPGPVTLAVHLFGENVLKSLNENSEEALEALDLVGELMLKLCNAYLEQGVEFIGTAAYMLDKVAISSFDAIAPVFQTLRNVAKYYKSKLITFTGDCPSEYIEPVFELPSDGVVVGGYTDLVLATNASIKHEKCLGIGLPSELSHFNEDETDGKIKEYLKLRGDARVFFSTAGEIPPGTPIPILHQITKKIAQ
ncbi:MAG: uroporphyrinogen decarboxylase family protein [Thermincola sp.]|jgi:uroporphyrinogen decarboxylase|nr:uroporphyrinogen decarboxylase family protein [Thermincola sp.]MDT3702837.1 uroporphyrinogen decarboxylase family protein [Thermincola sp.]